VGRLIETDAYGIHHLTDRTDGGISWYDFAVEIRRIIGMKTRIIPIPSSEYPTRAVRPAYSVLDTFFTEMLSGYTPPLWKDSIQRFLQNIN
jgi:dTDP-4-dehydrorhamnose reductase